MPAIRLSHVGRSVVPLTGSNSQRLPTMVKTMPTPVQKRGMPTCTSTANATIARPSRPDRPPARGQLGEAVARQDRARRADDAGDAHTGREELEDQQREADEEQQVRHRWAGDRVEQLIDQAELREACGGDRLALHGAGVGDPLDGGVEHHPVLLVAVERLEHVADGGDALVGDALLEDREVACLAEARPCCRAARSVRGRAGSVVGDGRADVADAGAGRHAGDVGDGEHLGGGP